MEPVVVLAVDLDAEDGAGHFHAPLALEPVSAPAHDEAAAAVPQPARPLREPSGRAAGKSSRPDRAARSTRGPNECERVRSERSVTGWGRGRDSPAPGNGVRPPTLQTDCVAREPPVRELRLHPWLCRAGGGAAAAGRPGSTREPHCGLLGAAPRGLFSQSVPDQLCREHRWRSRCWGGPASEVCDRRTCGRCRPLNLVRQESRVGGEGVHDCVTGRIDPPLRWALIRAGGRVRLGWQRSAHARGCGPAWCRRR